MTSEALGRSGPGTHVGGTWSLAGMMTAPFSGRAQWELSWGPGSKVPWSTFVLYPEDGEKLLNLGVKWLKRKFEKDWSGTCNVSWRLPPGVSQLRTVTQRGGTVPGWPALQDCVSRGRETTPGLRLWLRREGSVFPRDWGWHWHHRLNGHEFE